MVTSWRRWKNVPMSWVFHLMKIKLTKRMVFESPSWIRNGKKKIRSITVKFKSWKARAAFYKTSQKIM